MCSKIENIYWDSNNQNKSAVATFLLHKIDFIGKNLTRKIADQNIMIKGSIHKEYM